MITILSRITVTLVELLRITIVADNLKRKTVRDPLLSVRIFKNDSPNWSVSDQYMNLNDCDFRVQGKNHRIMKTKSFRFIYFTMTSRLFLSMLSSDNWKYDVSKSRSWVMMCTGHIIGHVSDEHLPHDWSRDRNRLKKFLDDGFWDRNRLKHILDDWFWDRDHGKITLLHNRSKFMIISISDFSKSLPNRLEIWIF